jgi:hypothetical protein
MPTNLGNLVEIDPAEQTELKRLRVPPLPTSRVEVGGLIHADLADHTTTGTSEETVASFTLPAKALNENKRGLRIRAWGITAANGNNKTQKIAFGTLEFSTGALAANNKDWELELDVWRDAADSQRIIGRGQANGAIVQVDYQAGTEDLDAAITIAIKVTDATAAGGTTLKGFTIESL